MNQNQSKGKDTTAALVALWRAIHFQLDPPLA
jgi:hypothetical protein